MQTKAMLITVRAIWDGAEIPGLAKVGEFKPEPKTGTVSTSKVEFTLKAFPRVLAPMDFEYIVERDTDTIKFFTDFAELDQVKNCIVIYSDGHGTEFKRLLLKNCECGPVAIPEVTTESPPVFKITVTIYPQGYKYIS